MSMGKYITQDPETLGGTPVFKGTRVPVKSLFSYISNGSTLDEFLLDFPSVKKEQAVETIYVAQKSVINELLKDEDSS